MSMEFKTHGWPMKLDILWFARLVFYWWQISIRSASTWCEDKSLHARLYRRSLLSSLWSRTRLATFIWLCVDACVLASLDCTISSAMLGLRVSAPRPNWILWCPHAILVHADSSMCFASGDWATLTLYSLFDRTLMIDWSLRLILVWFVLVSVLQLPAPLMLSRYFN